MLSESKRMGQSECDLAKFQKRITEAEARFFKVFSFIQNPAAILSIPDEKFVNVNYSFLELFGYRLNELIGRTLSDIKLWVDRNDYAKAKQITAEQGFLRNFSIQMLTKWDDILSGRLFIDFIIIDGRKYLFVQTLDMTAEERMMGALEESRQKVSNILERITDGFVELDNKLNFVYVNKEAERLFGKPREQLIGRCIAKEYPLLLDSDLLKESRRARNEQVDTHAEGFSGNINKWIEANYYPSEQGMSILFRDITARKEKEADLRRSKQEYKTLVENSCDVIIRFDKELRPMYINPAIEILIGKKPVELIGKTWEEIGVPKKVLLYNRWHQICEQVLASGEDVAFETEMPSSKGIKHFYIHTIPEFDSKGTVESVLSIIHDITDRKHMEKEMARLDRLNLVGEMAASIGHEVRNPMTTVRGFLQMLSRKREVAKFADIFGLMMEEIDRANSIITEFLSLAKNKAIDLKRTNLNTVIRAVFPLIQADALRMGNNIVADLGIIPDSMLDEKEIRQCILNFVRNGLEAMPSGGTVTIRTCVQDDKVVLAVKDEGCGIPAEILDKLGTPFLTTKECGTGLGLPVCYSIAERHKAEITPKTGPKGTTFFMRFETIDKAKEI